MEKRVIIPEESFEMIDFEQEGLPGIAVVNEALADFEHKDVFVWNCSIMIDMEEADEDGLPSDDEMDVLRQFEGFLDVNIKGEDREKPNALFVGRILWDSTYELIWKVYEPDVVNDFLKAVIENEDYPREFDFQIEEDEDWEITAWLFAD